MRHDVARVFASTDPLDPDPTPAGIKRAMIASARCVVVLPEHTKIDEDYIAGFGDLSDIDLSDIDLLVTDSGLGDAATAQPIQAGLAGARAGVPQHPRK
jgi:DeoR family fructose operon transcriptional repressor